MKRGYIPKSLRNKVMLQAKYRCGYCLTQLNYIGFGFDIEHLIPVSKGGLTIEDNLWLACSNCNDSKNDCVSAIDPLTKQEVALFNPRT